MTRFQQAAFAAAVFFAGTTAASAANVIDQNAPANNVEMTTFGNDTFGQSFQQSAFNISGAGIFLDPSRGTTDSVIISLWDKLPDQVGATILATSGGMGTAGSWFDVFWSPVSITPDTTYYLVFSGNTTLAVSGDTNNGYSRGSLFAGFPLSEYPASDYTFRTYASVSAVPEPETYAMLLTGLGVVGFIGKRRRAS